MGYRRRSSDSTQIIRNCIAIMSRLTWLGALTFGIVTSGIIYFGGHALVDIFTPVNQGLYAPLVDTIIGTRARIFDRIAQVVLLASCVIAAFKLIFGLASLTRKQQSGVKSGTTLLSLFFRY